MKLKSLMRMTTAAVMLALVNIGPVYADTPPDTLIIAHVLDDVAGLDPAEVFEVGGGEISNNIYLRLVMQNEADFSEIVGGAAESWEISEDGLTYTFKMRESLKFASGRPLSAEDAAFSLQRVVKLGKSPAFILTQFGWNRENVEEKVRATDDRTLTLTIEKPFAPSLVMNALSAGVGSVVDREAALANEKEGDLGNGWLRSHSAGAGPFVLRDWKPKETIVLEANDQYFAGKPKLNRVIYRHVPEATAQRLMLERGDVDMARQLGAEQLNALETNPDIKIEMTDKATVLYLAMNENVPELADPKVQEAIRLLVDYEGIAGTILDRQFRPHQSILSKGSFAALDDQPHRYNVTRAKELLAESGYPSGIALEFDVFAEPPYRDIAEALQASFVEAGIQLSLVASDRRQVLTKYRARNHQLALVRWAPDYGDPHSTVDFFIRNPDNSDSSEVKTAAWRNAWVSPKLQQVSDAAILERDAKTRTQMYLDLQRDLQSDSPFVVMFQQTESVAMRANVMNWTSGPTFDTYALRGITK